MDSVKRKFERDKDMLRAYGVPLEMTGTDVWDVEQGYIIPKDRYYLPEIAFTPEEITALYLAAQSGTESTDVAQGVRKLLYGAEGGLLDGSRRRSAGRRERHGPRTAARRPPGRRASVARSGSDTAPCRAPVPNGRSTPSAWCSEAATGTWSATTGTARPSARSGCRG